LSAECGSPYSQKKILELQQLLAPAQLVLHELFSLGALLTRTVSSGNSCKPRASKGLKENLALCHACMIIIRDEDQNTRLEGKY
jgi:hypothetical protein